MRYLTLLYPVPSTYAGKLLHRPSIFFINFFLIEAVESVYRQFLKIEVPRTDTVVVAKFCQVVNNTYVSIPRLQVGDCSQFIR